MLCRGPVADLLAKKIDDNVRVLSVLRGEMREHVQKAMTVYMKLKSAITRDPGGSHGAIGIDYYDVAASTSAVEGSVHYDALIAANIADNLERELLLVVSLVLCV